METNTALEEKSIENPAVLQVREWRKQGFKIGFANGCFDILHAGHVNLLNTARSNCDRLIVAITGDEQVEKQKGRGRPIMNADERAFIINGLAAVDMVLIITDETPLKVLEVLRPDIVAKGNDYKDVGFPEKTFIESYGCKIIYAPTLNSSRSIVNKCKKVLRNKKK